MSKPVKPGLHLSIPTPDPKILHEYPPLGLLPPPTPKRWEHDCDRCTYRGSRTFEDEHVDFYSCDQHTIGRTYIGRHGSGGPAYTSMDQTTILAMGPDEQVHWALKIMWHHAVIDKSAYSAGDFCFLMPRGDTLTVLIDPCIDPRKSCYIEDAVAAVGPAFQHMAMVPATLHQMLLEIRA